MARSTNKETIEWQRKHARESGPITEEEIQKIEFSGYPPTVLEQFRLYETVRTLRETIEDYEKIVHDLILDIGQDAFNAGRKYGREEGRRECLEIAEDVYNTVPGDRRLIRDYVIARIESLPSVVTAIPLTEQEKEIERLKAKLQNVRETIDNFSGSLAGEEQ